MERDYPNIESHYLPRSGAGRRYLASFLALFALAEPPILYLVANRIEPWILGLPFLYGYLLLVYGGLVATLCLALRRGL